MNAERAVNSLLGFQRFVQAIEGVLIDVVSMVIPWASPMIPAFLTWQAMTEKLRFPVWLALCAAGVVELLGLATINTVFTFWQYNQDARKSDPRSPVILAVLVSVFYLAVVLTTNTMLDNDPLVYKIAKGLLSSLSVAGGVTIALRASHSRRLALIAQEKQERKADRQERHVRQNSGMLDHDLLEAAPITLRRDWRTLNPDEREQVRDMSTYDIMRLYAIPDRTARQWKQLAKRNGNGHKEVVS